MDTEISSGSTQTTDSVTVSNDESVTFQFEGDGDSDNLDFVFQARVDDLDSWSNLDERNIDLTVFEQNNKLFPFDILDLEQFRVKITNKSSLATSLKVVSSHSEQQ